MKLKKTIITIVLITVGSLLVQAATHKTQTVTGLSAMRVASGLTNALYITAPPGDTQRLFIVRQTGQIHILNLTTGKLNPALFLNLSGKVLVTSEQGLLGMAFDPDYATNGKFYLDFVAPGGQWLHGTTHVSQFQR